MRFWGAVATLVVALTAVAFASHVNPVHYGDEEGEENNPSCAFLNSSWNEVKVNQAPNGDYPDSGGTDNPGGDGPLVFTVKNSNGEVFDWESNIGVDAVVVKGGNRGSNVYFYDPEESADTGLRSPPNTKGNRPAVSHISACYDVEAREEEQPGQQEEEPDEPEQPEGQDEQPGNEQPGNERPAEPDEPQEQGDEEPQDDDNAERPGDEPQDDEGDTEDAEEEDAPEGEDEQGEGDIEGVSETEEGEADDDIEEESVPGSSDDADSGDGNLPFTGAPVSPLILVALMLLLFGTAGRAGTRD
jgi:hypothetical protein